MKAVIYARYSSDNQREESIEGQLRECKEYAERNGILVLQSYIDRALSAKTDNRPEFQRMIRDSAKGLFDTVLVWKLDRFARNRYDSAHYKSQLRKNGVKVVSATESIADGPEGIILESMLEGMAEYYSAELAQKVNRGMRENALKARSNGGTIPLGYRLDEEHRLKIDPLTAPVVREVFQRYADGENLRTIIRSLNERGIRTSRNYPFRHSSFNTMLKNRKYIGEYHYKDVVIPDAVPPIISKELFERVQERMKKNQHAPARAKAEEEYLLTTKLFCGHCGRLMIGESGKGRNGTIHRYYKCAGAKRRLGCHKKAVKKDWIERVAVQYTIQRVFQDDLIAQIADELVALQGAEDSALPLLRRQLADTERGIENMLNAIQQGIFTSSTRQRLEELENLRAELKSSILQAELERPQYSREDIIQWISRFKGGDPNDKAYQRQIIDIFLNSIYVFDDKLVFTYNYKKGSQTVSLDEVFAAFGSDSRAGASPESRQTLLRLPAFPLFRGREKGRYGLWRAAPDLCLEDLAERKSAKQELQKAKRKFRQGSAPGESDRLPGRLAAGRTRAGPPSAKMLAKSRRLCYARNEKRRKGKVRQECAFAENFTQTCFFAVGFSPFVCAGIGRMLPGLSIFGNSLELCGNVYFRAFLRPDAPIRHLLQGQGGALMSKILLSANHIVHSFGERKILEFEKLTVYEGDRIGIVGTNGAGKTTLLNILSGELAPEEGSVTCKAPVSYFRQFRQRAERADPQKCSEFGLSGKLCRERLSGGEMTRLGLAAMGSDAVLTFADEPTANLDADGVELCCRMLEQCPTLLLVSHDRAVLDRLCTSIIEIKDGQLHFYSGGFTAFQKQREQAAGRQEFEYRQYQAEKARLEKAACRRSQAGKSVRKAPRRMGNSEARLHKREAAERAEKLESARKTILTRLKQLEAKEKPRETAPVRIDFSLTDPPANRQVAVGEHITFGYGKDLIFEDAAFSLPRGSKTALVGPNGAGKTTLMELIWSGAPGIRLVPKAKVGYFRQGLETLNLNKTVLENVMETSVQSENTMRGILARLLSRREDVFKKAGGLSGGERVKLAFAKLFGSPANLLLLDEPTNFLDMPAVEALQKMLEDYEGTVLFVSHDRAFSDGCATRTLRIADRKLFSFEGNLTAWEKEQRKPRQEKETEKALLELRLAEVIARLSVADRRTDKEELEKEFERLIARKKML